MHEMEARYEDDLRRMSNLDPLAQMTFDTFDSTVPGVKEAFKIAKKYASNPHNWLLLHGKYGCGKTHLAAAIANEAVNKKMRTLFTNAPDLLDHLRSTFAPTSEVQYDKMFETVRQVALLIIDDLGTENATPWASEKLYQIINHRYNYRLPTVITTNVHLDDIEPRIRSRITDVSLCIHVVIDAEDYRSSRRRRK